MTKEETTKAQTVPELSIDPSQLSIGIDFASGTEKIFVTVAQKSDDGNIYIISSQVISKDLALYIQAQETELTRLREALEEANATICSEFCTAGFGGKDEHHYKCDPSRKALSPSNP